MKFLTGLCQHDVTTSSDDVISRNKFNTQSCAEENVGNIYIKFHFELCNRAISAA